MPEHAHRKTVFWSGELWHRHYVLLGRLMTRRNGAREI